MFQAHFRYMNTFLLAICVFFFALCPWPLSAAEEGLPRHVLILHSYYPDYQWTENVMAGMEEVFAAAEEDIQLHVEYMDTKRYHDPYYLVQILEDGLQHKLANRSFDLVLVSDNDAFNFAIKHRNDLFAKTPLVFCGVNQFHPAMIAGIDGVTGVAEIPSVLGTIELALELHPGTEEVVVISNTRNVTDRLLQERLPSFVPQFGDRVRFTYWDNLPLEEMTARLQKLTAGRVVLLNSSVVYQAEVALSISEGAARMRQASAVPIYGLWDFVLGNGLVGGELVSSKKQGQLAAQLALRILRGETPDDIPAISNQANEYMFDYRELQRFGIALKSLPGGSSVINKPPSFYQVNKRILWAVLGVATGLVVSIVLLLINIRSRKQTERELIFREALEGLIARISTRFVELSPLEADQGIDLALQELGEFAGTDRSYVFLFSADRVHMDNTHEWCAEQILPQKENLQGIPISELPWALGKIMDRQVLHIPSVSDLPPEAKTEKEHWEAQNIQSLITVPVLSAGDVMGFLGFDVVRSEKLWAEKDLVLFQTVGEILGNAIERMRAEDALRKSGEVANALVNATLESLILVNPEGVVLTINQVGAARFGKTPDELIGIDIFSCLPPELEQARRRRLAEVVRTGKPVHFEDQRDEFYLLNSYYPAFDDQGNVEKVAIFSLDFADRKRAEESLRESEERFRSIFEHAAAGMGIVAPDGTLLQVNPAVCGFLGYPKQELLRLKVEDFTHPADRERTHRLYNEMMAGKRQVVDYEKRYLRKDGTTVWGRTILAPVYDADQNLCYFIAMLQDVTDRKRAEESLQQALAGAEEARDKIQAILESAADGLIFTDMDDRMVLMSASAEALLDKKLSATFLRPLEAAIVDKKLREQISAIKANGETEFTLELDLPGGEQGQGRIIQAKSSLVRGKGGIRSGVITLLRDVSREKELDRMKSEFISTAAHELRTPLTSVKGYSQLLLTDKDLGVEQQTEFLSIIDEKANVLETIIDDLLDLSRVESGRVIQVEKHWYDLGPVLAGLVGQYQTGCKTHRFKTILPENPVELMVDQGKIVQVMENLLSNAVKFSPEDSLIQVTCGMSAREVQISVKDIGIGMTAQQMERIFDKFYRVDSSLTAKEGLGLGMSIAKNIVEAHGGRIWVESELDQGTTVSFTIPLGQEIGNNN